jgi:hypothetical protein
MNAGCVSRNPAPLSRLPKRTGRRRVKGPSQKVLKSVRDGPGIRTPDSIGGKVSPDHMNAAISGRRRTTEQISGVIERASRFHQDEGGSLFWRSRISARGSPMRRISCALASLLLVGLTQAQQNASPVSHSIIVETRLLSPPHATVSVTGVSISEQLDGPHWWNDHATYHSIYSHGEVPNVAMTSRDGTVAFKTTLRVPNLDRIRVTDAAATNDGGAVATATVVDKMGKPTSFVAQLDNSGTVVRQITTFPFMAEMTCPADDGTVWVFGWDFSENHGPHVPYSILRHYSFTQGLLKVALDWTAIGNSVLFGHQVAGGTAVACTARKAWVYYGERRQFIAYDEETNSFRTYRVQLPDGSPDDLGVSGFARTATGDFYASLNDSSEAWLGLYWLKVHDGVAEWIAVDAPGNFENGIRIFGSSGDDIVYARVAWQIPKELEFSAMPPKMASKLLLNADRRHRESHWQPSF